MLLGYFRKFQAFTPFALLIVSVLLWADVYLFPEQVFSRPEGGAGPLYRLIEPFVQAYPLLSSWIAIVFLLLQSFYLNHVANTHGLSDRYSFLTGFVYFLFMSSHGHFHYLHPVLFSNAFLIIALNRIFDTSDEKNMQVEVFNSGFLIALAGMFFQPSSIILLMLIASMFIYYIIGLRSILAAASGFMLPFFFLWLYYYLSGSWQDILIPYKIKGMAFSWSGTPIEGRIAIVFFAGLSLASFIKMILTEIQDKPIRLRRRYWIVVYFFVSALISFVLFRPLQVIHTGLLAIPLSMIVAGFFGRMRRGLVAELLFLLMISLTLLSLLGKGI